MSRNALIMLRMPLFRPRIKTLLVFHSVPNPYQNSWEVVMLYVWSRNCFIHISYSLFVLSTFFTDLCLFKCPRLISLETGNTQELSLEIFQTFLSESLVCSKVVPRWMLHIINWFPVIFGKVELSQYSSVLLDFDFFSTKYV